MTQIDNNQDILDSRDIITRLEELDDEIEGMYEGLSENDKLDLSAPIFTEIDNLEDERQSLRDLIEEASSSPDWSYGETLIRDSYFKIYAQELAESCGMINDTSSWPCRHIDWEQAADELQIDYTCVDFDGVCYWVLDKELKP